MHLNTSIMEQTQEKVNLRVLIDKDKNKVVFAEAGGDFVDILLSFLTLPMATIVRLVNTCPDGPQVKLGSLSTLYESVVNIEPQHFSDDQCKDMLITPRNLWEAMCKKLKINVDNTEPLKYFLCRSCWSGLSTKENTRCSCGELMNWKIGVKEDADANVREREYEGVFVTESASYIITDDLSIRQNSVGGSVNIINNLGIRDMTKIDSLSISLGLKEITYLLKLSMISKTPMTDLVLGNVGLSEIRNAGCGVTLSSSGASRCKVMIIRLMVQKSVKKVLFALVEKDFVDFLFSILAIPLGSLISLLGDNYDLESSNKLYNSIDNLNVENLVKSCDLKYKLLYPLVAPDYFCKGLAHPPIARGGFVSKPATFMVADNLAVTPRTSTSSISALNLLKVPISDVQETMVHIYPKEALSILKASVNSTSALTDFLSETQKTSTTCSLRAVQFQPVINTPAFPK